RFSILSVLRRSNAPIRSWALARRPRPLSGSKKNTSRPPNAAAMIRLTNLNIRHPLLLDERSSFRPNEASGRSARNWINGTVTLIAAFCCKVLHFIASSRGDSGACCTAESAVALSAATVEVRASAVFCCIVLAAGNKVLHAEQPRGIIARPDDRHHQMLVRP